MKADRLFSEVAVYGLGYETGSEWVECGSFGNKERGKQL